jgi:hypothetical protein
MEESGKAMATPRERVIQTGMATVTVTGRTRMATVCRTNHQIGRKDYLVEG